MLLSLAEIVNKTCEMKTKEDKVEFLQKNSTEPLKTILRVMYDKKSFKLLIPSTNPPYAASEYPDSQGILYREVRKFKYFYENPQQGNIDKIRRESLFIQMLESVHKEDAVLLCKMIKQKPLKGLTAETINQAFPGLLPTKSATENV